MSFAARLETELAQFKKEGVYKRLNYLDAPQGARTVMEGRGEVVILSSNNYLGLCTEPDVVAAGKRALDQFGAGTGSVRFICGTFTIHRELEQALARFVGCESALTYASCWNANEGLVATLLGEQDIVISDQLNHASIIDAIRLAKSITKCQTAVYRHSDMADREEKLRAARAMNSRLKLIFTDGVFSMEGDIARLPDIVTLARRYDAVVAMDDSHGTGVLGRSGRGTAEHYDMLGQVDIITSTLGKALGGPGGGLLVFARAAYRGVGEEGGIVSFGTGRRPRRTVRHASAAWRETPILWCAYATSTRISSHASAHCRCGAAGQRGSVPLCPAWRSDRDRRGCGPHPGRKAVSARPPKPAGGGGGGVFWGRTTPWGWWRG